MNAIARVVVALVICELPKKAKVTNGKGELEYFDLSPRAAQFEAGTESTEESLQEQLEEGMESNSGLGAGASIGGLSCVAWRAVEGCSPENANRKPENDKNCTEWIGNGDAGWCECEYEFIARESSCIHEMFNCADACAHHDRKEAQAKQESAEIAPTIDTEIMVGIFAEHSGDGFSEYIPQNINAMLGRNLPFVIFMLCDCDQELRWPIEDLVAHSKWAQLKDKFNLGWMRPEVAAQWEMWDNFAIEGGPALGIDNIPLGQNLEKFVLRHEEGGGQLRFRPEVGVRPPRPVVADEIIAFLQGFVDETLPLVVKSEELPRGGSDARRLRGAVGAVTKVVGASFVSVVMDESKDVAVLFYAPWCGGSQKVEPVYEKLAQLMKADDSVVLTKMDCTKNDIPVRGVQVLHYPQLWLWPKGSKKTPVDYRAYNHENEDGDSGHSHFELGMMLDFLQHKQDRQVREAHHDGAWDSHLMDV